MRLAEGFWERLVGMRALHPGQALLLAARSVHGIGLSAPLTVVGLDGGGTVVGVRVLRPGRVVSFRRARWMLELPAGEPAPAIGTRVAGGPLPQEVPV